MSKLLRAVLISAYCAVTVQFLKSLLMDRSEEIININYKLRSPGLNKRLNRELKKRGRNSSTMDFDFKPPDRLPTDLKYILKYTEGLMHYSSSIYRNGQKAFIDSNCSYYNCFMTNDKSFLLDLRNFDAILFDVENTWDTYPPLRSMHQKYIFTASESADNYPVCHPLFDAYYNWTWTYRLDSDIRWTYITIFDKTGKVVGPKINMTWVHPMQPISAEAKKKFSNKKRAAAWFVSNCFAKSGRERVTKNIEKALSKYGLTIDIYGWCGNLTCSSDRMEYCEELLEQDYYFYLAFENSLCIDYVTEKVLFPLQHNSVPVVFGGADYSRFLPPKSYINAGELDANAVASLMIEAIYDKNTYYRYFDWYNHYTFKEAPVEADICTLCKLLNENRSESIVTNFRNWWFYNHTLICHEEVNETVVEFRI